MALRAESWPLDSGQQTVVSRVLIHLPESSLADALIPFAVNIAQNCQALVRGLTIIDTSHFDHLVSQEAAAYAAFELKRLEAGAARRDAIRSAFSHACLTARIAFDIHCHRGRALDILTSEARLHDLSVTVVPRGERRGSGHLKIAQVTAAILQGVSPLLVLRERIDFPKRILLVQDGTTAASRAIRTFLAQALFSDAQVRLLTIGPSVAEARNLLHAHVVTVRHRVPELETGYISGRATRIVPHYAQHWGADLVVLGTRPSSELFHFFRGETTRAVLKQTNCAVFCSD